MTLHQLRTFATVARFNSYTQAANHLQISQPSVSLVLHSLEKELGVQLFEKLQYKIRLTDVGEKLLERTKEVLVKVRELLEEVDKFKGLEKRRLTVGGSLTAASSLLPATVREFKIKYPEVEVILKFDRSRAIESKLLEGEIDIAVTGRLPQSDLLVSVPHHDEEIVVIAPPTHPLCKQRSVSLELIAKEPLIAHEKGTAVREMISSRFADKHLSFVPSTEIPLQLGSRDAIRTAVMSGFGIAFLPKCHVLPDLKAGMLKVINVPGLSLKRAMYVAFHKDRQDSSLIQGFIQSMKTSNKKN